MSLSTLGVDAYQLTTLVAHADAGRLDHRVAMAFFFRKMPKGRGYVVFCGLRQILRHAAAMRLSAGEIDVLRKHPILGPVLASRPAIVAALEGLDAFDGEIDAAPEGTLVYAGPAVRTDGKPLEVGGAQLSIYTPLMQVRTDMVRAKLIETPWLGYINHLSMVATKAARVVDASAGKVVLEFGARRTHPHAAVDASYAAHVAGCTATSNLAAHALHGVPATGTMDHFAVQASERPGVSTNETEGDFYATFVKAFPNNANLLVDTYDTERGIRNAVTATGGKLTGIRLDSNVSVASIARARAILDEMGAKHAKIFVSDGLDERKVAELAPHADGFGVGENITCSPDAATGIGAVAKLVVNGYGKITMKVAKGTGKATLPGELQTYRFADHDLVALASEPAPAGAKPLLEPVWRGNKAVRDEPGVDVARAHVREQVAHLPASLRAFDAAPSRKLVASDGLVALIEKLCKEALP